MIDNRPIQKIEELEKEINELQESIVSAQVNTEYLICLNEINEKE